MKIFRNISILTFVTLIMSVTPVMAHNDEPMNRCKTISTCQTAETYYFHAFKVALQGGDLDEACKNLVSDMAARSVEGALANDSTILVDASETGDVIISKCNDSAAMRARAMKQSIRHLLDSE